MKKLATLILAMTIGFSSFSQAVDDQAVIPLSVTLNSILRLNVTSGGNIEFLFSSIDHYTNGIGTSTRYETAFTVSSSVDFDVNLEAETGTLTGQDNPGNTMTLAVIDYYITGLNGANSTYAPAAAAPLVAGANLIVTPTGVLHNAGSAVVNAHVIHWACGDNATSIQSLNPAADRYSTNIFLTVAKHP